MHGMMRTALIAALLATAVAVTACGRKGALEPPPDSEYPRPYPAPASS